MQSYSLSINGGVLQQVRMDQWKATVDKLFYPSAVMQRRFGRCGGAWNAWDSVAVSGQSFVSRQVTVTRADNQAANAASNGQTRMVFGFTQDSGIAKRIQGLLACTKAAPVVVGNNDTRIIRIRAPLEGCGILNPLGRQDYVSSASPLRNGTFVIPHANIVQIQILWKRLFEY